MENIFSLIDEIETKLSNLYKEVISLNFKNITDDITFVCVVPYDDYKFYLEWKNIIKPYYNISKNIKFNYLKKEKYELLVPYEVFAVINGKKNLNMEHNTIKQFIKKTLNNSIKYINIKIENDIPFNESTDEKLIPYNESTDEKLIPYNESTDEKLIPYNETTDEKLIPFNESTDEKLIPYNETTDEKLIPFNESTDNIVFNDYKNEEILGRKYDNKPEQYVINIDPIEEVKIVYVEASDEIKKKWFWMTENVIRADILWSKVIQIYEYEKSIKIKPCKIIFQKVPYTDKELLPEETEGRISFFALYKNNIIKMKFINFEYCSLFHNFIQDSIETFFKVEKVIQNKNYNDTPPDNMLNNKKPSHYIAISSLINHNNIPENETLCASTVYAMETQYRSRTYMKLYKNLKLKSKVSPNSIS